MTAVVKVKQRRGDRLGASDAPVVLGLVPGRGPINVWLRMTGREVSEPPTELMEFGTDLEPVIRAKYVNRTGHEVYVPSESLMHPTCDFLQATPDGICLSRPFAGEGIPPRELWSHGLEVKAPKARQRPDWGDDETTVPDRVLVQVMCQLSVMELPFSDAAAEIDREYVQRRVTRDLSLEGDILTALEDFWKHVKNDTPPPVDETESYAEYLRKKLERASQTMEATPELEAVLDDWHHGEVAMKQAKAVCDLSKNQVMAAMVERNATRVMSTHGPIYMQSGRVTYDDKALAQDLCTRLQLRGEPIDFNAERERFRKQGDAFPRRPNGWTK